jgi:hypothetical protein
MKRQITNHLSGRRLILPALTVLALSILTVPASAQARVRIGVKVNTPIGTAVVHSGGHGSGLQIRVPARHHRVIITKTDRRIARKLSKRTQYSKRELLQLRRVGYSWNEVGRLLRLPKRLMRSVLHSQRIKCGNDSRLDYNDSWDRYDERDDRRSRSMKKVKRIR